MVTDDQVFQADVSVTLNHCPDNKYGPDPRGRLEIPVTAGIETWIRFDAPDYVPWVLGEVRVEADMPMLVAKLAPVVLADALVPGYAPDRPIVFLQVQPGPELAPEPCRLPDGAQIHLEPGSSGTVLYRSSGADGRYGDIQMTTEEGVAVVRDLPAHADYLDIGIDKVGCEYRASYGDAHSTTEAPILRTPLFPGAITYQSFNPVW